MPISLYKNSMFAFYIYRESLVGENMFIVIGHKSIILSVS